MTTYRPTTNQFNDSSPPFHELVGTDQLIVDPWIVIALEGNTEGHGLIYLKGASSIVDNGVIAGGDVPIVSYGLANHITVGSRGLISGEQVAIGVTPWPEPGS